MACCGNNRKPVRSNQNRAKNQVRSQIRTSRKTCPRCGWIMNRVHKYDTNKKAVIKYWLCSNKSYKKAACNFRELIK